jgi:hypothetical protein
MEIDIPFLNEDNMSNNLVSLASLMDQLPIHSINNNPWPQFNTNVKAGFSIFHNDNEIGLKYYVNEDVLKATSRYFNEDVHKDNCVEFFIEFEQENQYYNIEVNCLGSIKVGYGKGTIERRLLPQELLKKIAINVVMKYILGNNGPSFKWELLIIIPSNIFCYTNLSSFSGLKCKANFYKCGDDLPNPHFLTWNKIIAETPDFHLPEFFGQLNFVSK